MPRLVPHPVCGRLLVPALLALLLQPAFCRAAPETAAAPSQTPAQAGGRGKGIPHPPALAELERILRDLERFDALAEPAAVAESGVAALSLQPPAPLALPQRDGELSGQQRVRLGLAEVLALAVNNSPTLAQSVSAVQQQRALLGAAWGRFSPTLSLGLSGGGGLSQNVQTALLGNSSFTAASSPFYVDSGTWKKSLQTNLGARLQLTEAYVVVDFARAAALARARDQLEASNQAYGDGLRQLQLQISETYYGIQLAQLRQRIRAAELFNSQVVRDQAQALLRSGLVPRVDLFRADAALQQSRFLLIQAEADLLSQERLLSNQVNVPFDVTLLATDPVRLQPPWPLDLSRTLVAGFQANPQLRAIEAARSALIRQADEQAAALLPTVSVFVSAELGQLTTAESRRVNNGCCGAAVIPELASSTVGWAAGVRVNWQLMDGGVSRSLAEASRTAATATAQQQAEQRNAIRQRLEQAFFHHRAALSQVIAARASLKAAREAFRDMRARYQLGLADYTDVSDTILALTQAMEQKAIAITTANISYARMLRDLLPVPTDPLQPVSLPLTLPERMTLQLGPAPASQAASSASP